jgi:hypothetical protein
VFIITTVLMFCAGIGCDKNLQEAFGWYRKAAKQNHARAQNKLALCFLNGLGVDANAIEAVRWFRAAAAQNFTAAMFHLGNCLEQGDGCEKNLDDALMWYERAAANGDANANERLTRLLTNGCFAAISRLPLGHAACCA